MQFKETISVEYNLSRENEEITIFIDANVSFSSGNYFDTPENCYDDEVEVELISIRNENEEDILDQITDLEEDRIRQVVIDEAMEFYYSSDSSEFEEEDYFDYDPYPF